MSAALGAHIGVDDVLLEGRFSLRRRLIVPALIVQPTRRMRPILPIRFSALVPFQPCQDRISGSLLESLGISFLSARLLDLALTWPGVPERIERADQLGDDDIVASERGRLSGRVSFFPFYIFPFYPFIFVSRTSAV